MTRTALLGRPWCDVGRPPEERVELVVGPDAASGTAVRVVLA